MEFIKKYWNNELFRGSFILLILSNISNLFNFLFQFFMARMLSSTDFGILSFLSNLLFLFGVPALAIQMTISKKTTELKIKNENGKIKGLLESAIKKLFLMSLIFIAGYLILSYAIKDFVKIPYGILALFSLMIPISLIYPAIIGVIQGMKKFEFMGMINVFTFGIKFFLGIILVLLGWKIWGALVGVIIGTYFVLILGFIPLNKIKEEKQKANINIKEKYFEIIGLLIITLAYSVDVLIAKFIFSPEEMGNYSKISLLGKMVLFAGMTISTVMFPISSEKKIIGQETKNVFRKALILNLIIIGMAVIALFFFGVPLISLIFGKGYALLSEIAKPVILSFSFITLTVFLILYGISINLFKKLEAFLFSIGLLIQIAILSISMNLNNFINSFLYTSLGLLVLAIILNIKWKKSA